MYARLDAAELPSSPPKIKKGLSFIISCAFPFRVSRCGADDVCADTYKLNIIVLHNNNSHFLFV
jgi:hypothetical protein